MKKILLLISTLVIGFGTLAGDGKLYTWTDENGVVHYSDKPHPKAKEVVVDESSQVRMDAVDTSILDRPEQQEADLPQFEVTIVSPTQEETVRDNEGNVPVSIKVAPMFLPSYKLQVLLDGVPQQGNGPLNFTLENVDRGEHRLQVKLLDRTGREVAVSEPRTFFLHRISVLTKPSGL
ncbi:DUF4124 domain-containing protein [Gallaecimonas sp. GXIMD4217]|uniref:DUF4124 domain-containing protein n=1 Tax=Gallaecimonas sp. GXIMD4217 TaxID=3131927 RepID=UPI00311B426F